MVFEVDATYASTWNRIILVIFKFSPAKEWNSKDGKRQFHCYFARFQRRKIHKRALPQYKSHQRDGWVTEKNVQVRSLCAVSHQLLYFHARFLSIRKNSNRWQTEDICFVSKDGPSAQIASNIVSVNDILTGLKWLQLCIGWPMSWNYRQIIFYSHELKSLSLKPNRPR